MVYPSRLGKYAGITSERIWLGILAACARLGPLVVAGRSPKARKIWRPPVKLVAPSTCSGAWRTRTVSRTLRMVLPFANVKDTEHLKSHLPAHVSVEAHMGTQTVCAVVGESEKQSKQPVLLFQLACSPLKVCKSINLSLSLRLRAHSTFSYTNLTLSYTFDPLHTYLYRVDTIMCILFLHFYRGCAKPGVRRPGCTPLLPQAREYVDSRGLQLCDESEGGVICQNLELELFGFNEDFCSDECKAFHTKKKLVRSQKDRLVYKDCFQDLSKDPNGGYEGNLAVDRERLRQFYHKFLAIVDDICNGRDPQPDFPFTESQPAMLVYLMLLCQDARNLLPRIKELSQARKMALLQRATACASITCK